MENQFLNFLIVLQQLKQNDIRLNVHSLYKDEDETYQHNDKKCPMCIADYYLSRMR